MKKTAFAPALALAAATVMLVAPGCAPKPAPADLVFLNGDVFTVDPAHPAARAIAIRGGTIAAVCDTDRQARRYIGPKTRVFDLLGKFVLPGLIDARVRFEAAGAFLGGGNLRGVSDEAGLRKEIRRVVDLLDDGEWITDGFWGAAERTSPEAKAPWRPNRTMIDDLTLEHPCFLCRFDGKEWLANGAALAAAGLGGPRPAGLEVGSDGKPTGIVFPGTPAFDRLKKAIKPKPDLRLLDESRVALQALREAGITGIGDAAAEPQILRFVDLEKNGELTCRVRLIPDPARAAALKAQGFAAGLHPATKQKSLMLRYGPLDGDAEGVGGGREARLTAASDWPGTDSEAYGLKPTDLIRAAVTGQAPAGGLRTGWHPERKISVEDAIRAYTINNAAAASADDALGSLTPGKRADLAVFDKNLLKIPAEEIASAQVTHTVVDGKIVFRRRIPAPARKSR